MKRCFDWRRALTGSSIGTEFAIEQTEFINFEGTANLDDSEMESRSGSAVRA
jgi:hypothetical protein